MATSLYQTAISMLPAATSTSPPTQGIPSTLQKERLRPQMSFPSMQALQPPTTSTLSLSPATYLARQAQPFTLIPTTQPVLQITTMSSPLTPLRPQQRQMLQAQSAPLILEPLPKQKTP